MLSVGTLLKNTRERKKISLRDVEKHIKIREKFIVALEEDRWNIFTSKIYIMGILKNYARFLSLDEQKILAFFRREYEKKDDVRFKERISGNYMSSDSKKTILTGFILLGILFIFYFSFQLYQYITPPKIEILSPTTSVFKRESTITIVGKTEKEAMVTILGERVYQNKEGIFEYVLPLKQKNTVLSIEVVGANGKKTQLDKIFKKTQ
ncbi:MAG: helix-turn-helix domain-containing protein [Microgenomates group bacterium]